jgi:integrase
LRAAKKIIPTPPTDDVQIIPRKSKHQVDHGKCLDANQMRDLIRKSQGHALYSIVVFACLTGARRGEILALQWSDVDLIKKEIVIRRSLEQTKAGITVKGTKTGTEREIGISDDLVDLLAAERARHLRIVAGVPDGTDVDLSLVRLPQGALVFPLLSRGDGVDLMRLRSPKAVTSMFSLLAAGVGYKGLRFHDLRGSHGTALLNAGEPVAEVARRLGHDPAMLLRSYAKRTGSADKKIVQSVARHATHGRRQRREERFRWLKPRTGSLAKR